MAAQDSQQRSEFARTIRLGFVLAIVGILGMLIAFGPARFADRISGRVDVEGVVQWGVTVDARGPGDTIEDGERGVWKVDYEIDGQGHTGAILGRYREGQKITLSAPSDGSFEVLLHEATPTPVKVLSWFLALGSLIALTAGAWLLVSGLRHRTRAVSAEAIAQQARRYPHLYPQPTAQRPEPPEQSGERHPSAQREQNEPPSSSRTDFFGPYDL